MTMTLERALDVLRVVTSRAMQGSETRDAYDCVVSHLAQPAQSDNVNLTRLAETKLAYLRERGYTQQAVVMTGPGGCCTVSNLGRVIWLKDPSELAITGAERTAKQIHDEAGMPPNP